MPDHYYNHSRRGGRSLAEPYPSSPYPGISSYGQPPFYGESGMLPAVGTEAAAETALAVPVTEAAAAKPGGLLGGLGNLGNLANMEQIKGIVDRLGGVDGIVNSMGKVQKVMQGFQQMAPMMKLVMGSFGKKKGSGAGELAAEEDAALYSPKRRKKRRQGSQPRKKKAPKSRRKSSPASVKRRRK
ncbi:hypothetical protein [Paenibacillus sp. P46E]|uniref:hypothetical protein n=1 Tax=Paenibacillus sp. P46E TaxID=1349436 RepID=UPI00093B1EC9|nr:hypothetical protein [Paenibacillus sp. P46E]OKP97009.1 hypothetical protein A3849_17835 [Paenibacillus sp. P46E]